MNMHMSSSNAIHIFKRFAFEHCGTISLKINDILIHNFIFMNTDALIVFIVSLLIT